MGLPHFVGKSFFEHILTKENALLEDHVDSYLAILATRPLFAGMGQVKSRVCLTCCGLMVRNVYFLTNIYIFLC